MRQRNPPSQPSKQGQPVASEKCQSQPKVGPHLGSYSEVADYLKVDYILSGYRIGYNFFLCLISLFQIHNETVNIWTHFGGALFGVFVSFQVYSNFIQYGLVHVFFHLFFLLGCIYGLGSSAVFHWFNCISADHHKCLRTLDFGGIGVVIITMSAPITYYGLYCHETYLKFFLSLIAVLSPLLVCMPFLHSFHQNKWLRTFIFVTSSLIPCLDWAIITFHDGLDSPLQTLLFRNIVGAYLSFGLGLFLYITRYPECLWPGAFDLLGTSHQIWHLLVLIGMTLNYTAVLATFYFRISSDTCLI